MQLKCSIKLRLEMVTLPKCSNQIGNHDCRLFAIAFCTALAHVVPLSEVILKQYTMWHHLIKCFEQLKMSPFRFKYSS